MKMADKVLAKDLTIDLIDEGREKGFTAADMADFVNVSVSAIEGYVYRDDLLPSLPVFIGLWRKIKPQKALKTMAKWSNCVVLPFPEVERPFFSLMTKRTAETLKEFSEFIDAISDAMKDGKITTEEAKQIEKEGLEAVAKILEIIHVARDFAR